MLNRRIRQTVGLIGLLFGIAASPALALEDDTALTRFQYPAWFKQTFYDLRDDLDEADANGKRGLMVFFSTEGCAYCAYMLRQSFQDSEPGRRIRENFDVIGLETFDDAEITDWHGATRRIKDFAQREGVQFTPTLVFYDTTGHRLLRLVGYHDAARLSRALDYLDSPAAGSVAYGDWIKTQSAPPAGGAASATTGMPPFAAPPYRFERGGAQRPLLVVFGKAQCAECARLNEGVLADPAVRYELSAFEVIHLDAADRENTLTTPGGSSTTPAAWMAQLGLVQLPALAWFDEQGGLVLKTDATLLKGRFLNALGFVRERAYRLGWSFQRYARAKSLERLDAAAGNAQPVRRETAAHADRVSPP